MVNPFDPLQWIARGRELCELARTGKVPDVELTIDVSAWPQTQIAAELLTHDLGTDRAIDAEMVLYTAHAISAKPTGDVDALLDRGDLEGAWRACFAPEIADAIEAADAAIPLVPVKEPKKKSAFEAAWAAAAAATSPKSLFAGNWPSKWKDAIRRVRHLNMRGRSPLIAASAITFANRDDLPYTSIGSQAFWQAFAWFIAEQADVRQLPALEAIEKRIATFAGRKDLYATDALRAFKPKALSDATLARIAKLVVAKPAKPVALSLASPEERAVAADQLMQAGDPRGEFITVQERIVKAPTDELVKLQNKLLKKHAKAWAPPQVNRATCVFRGGVPVAGHLAFRSDSELRSFIGSKALATFETLIVDESFAMGPIEPTSIAELLASLPNLRCAITTDEGAHALVRGEPTQIQHIAVPGNLAVILEGPGLPALRRADAAIVRPSWQSLFGFVDEIGCESPEQWLELRREHEAASTFVLYSHAFLHKMSASAETPWELVAWGDTVTARPQVGSTAASLASTLASVGGWKDVKLRVPNNFVDAVEVKADIEAIEPVEIARLGISLDLI